jgi:hypothetical protein
MCMQPSRGTDLWIVERRDDTGVLDFTGPQPPPEWIPGVSLDDLYAAMFREDANVVGTWDNLRTWIKAKGWTARRKTW